MTLSILLMWPGVERAVLLAYAEGERWRPSIGDPTVMGWVTVGAYFAAAFLCGRAALALWREDGDGAREFRLWLLLALGLGFLGVNKQLDLQTWFTLTGKGIAQAQGWYEQRRVVQAAFIGVMAIAGGWGVFWVWRQMREAGRATWLALAGFIFLGSFILIRAASFHMVDWFLKWAPGGVRMNWVLELGGIFLLGWAALNRVRDGTERSVPPPAGERGGPMAADAGAGGR